MADVVLLTDTVIHGEMGNTRYMAPYVLASQLIEQGHDTAVIDYFTRIPNFFEYLDNFLKPTTLAVGICSTFLMPQLRRNLRFTSRVSAGDTYHSGLLWLDTAAEFKAWLQQLRALIQKRCPNAQIVLGGTKAVDALNRPQHYQGIDYVAIGPSDLSFSQFIQELSLRQEPKHMLRNGFKVLDNTASITNKICPETIWTHKFAVQKSEGLPLEVSRGCIFNCKFCHYDKKASTRKDLEIIRREIERNYEYFGVTNYSFCDDCFNDSRTKVESICEMLLQLPFKIEWISYVRADVSVRFPHITELMVESGARALFFGLESFDPIVARNAGKGTPTEKVQEFLIDFSNKYRDRCLLQGSFITGLPGETVESLRKTTDWIIQNPVLDFVSIGPLSMYQYSPTLDKAVIDYAEYSRDPAKWGFKRIEFKPYYWEHSTMNSDQAKHHAIAIYREWQKAGHDTLLQNMWLYPHLRGLGFTKEEIFDMARNPQTKESWRWRVIARFSGHLDNYWKDLLTAQKQPAKRKSPDPVEINP